MRGAFPEREAGEIFLQVLPRGREREVMREFSALPETLSGEESSFFFSVCFSSSSFFFLASPSFQKTVR